VFPLECVYLQHHVDVQINVQVTVHHNSYNKNQPDALISQIYFWNKTLHVLDSLSVHRQEFFTVHTAVVYVIWVC